MVTTLKGTCGQRIGSASDQCTVLYLVKTHYHISHTFKRRTCLYGTPARFENVFGILVQELDM